jgi:hypothetical protein
MVPFTIHSLFLIHRSSLITHLISLLSPERINESTNQLINFIWPGFYKQIYKTIPTIMTLKTSLAPALLFCAALSFTACSDDASHTETSTTTTSADSLNNANMASGSTTTGTVDAGANGGMSGTVTTDANGNTVTTTTTGTNGTTGTDGTVNGEVNTSGTTGERVWDETKQEWKEARGGVKGAYKEGKQETKEVLNGGKGD